MPHLSQAVTWAMEALQLPGRVAEPSRVRCPGSKVIFAARESHHQHWNQHAGLQWSARPARRAREELSPVAPRCPHRGRWEADLFSGSPAGGLENLHGDAVVLTYHRPRGVPGADPGLAFDEWKHCLVLLKENVMSGCSTAKRKWMPLSSM